METSDNELISKYLAGDGDALATLIERYTRPIYGFAMRMTGDEAISSDVTQETFVKVWRTLARFREGASFKAWIFSIARNTAIDQLRKRKMPVFSDFEMDEGKNWVNEHIPDPETIPAELIQKAAEHGLLEKATKELSPTEQEVMRLRYQEDMTFAEIGQALDQPLDTVKSRHHRALKKLREFFEKSSDIAPNYQ